MPSPNKIIDSKEWAQNAIPDEFQKCLAFQSITVQTTLQKVDRVPNQNFGTTVVPMNEERRGKASYLWW